MRPDPRIRPQPREVDGIIHWPLTRADPAQGLHAFKVRIPPGRIPEMRVHEGHDWIYVLSGRLRLSLGDDDLIVEPGEAAEFSTLVPHWIGAIDEPVGSHRHPRTPRRTRPPPPMRSTSQPARAFA